MIRALYSAASGMTAQQINVDNISHNLANANTTGFKARRAQFQDLLYQNIVSSPEPRPRNKLSVPTGFASRTRNSRRIERDHLLARQFRPDQQSAGYGDPGSRVFSSANAVRRVGVHTRRSLSSRSRRQSGHIRRQPDRAFRNHTQGSAGLSIGTDGTVSYTMPGQTEAQQAGQIQLADFQNPAGLDSMGRNLYKPTSASGDPRTGISRRAGRTRLVDAGLSRSNPTLVWSRSSSI